MHEGMRVIVRCERMIFSCAAKLLVTRDDVLRWLCLECLIREGVTRDGVAREGVAWEGEAPPEPNGGISSSIPSGSDGAFLSRIVSVAGA